MVFQKQRLRLHHVHTLKSVAPFAWIIFVNHTSKDCDDASSTFKIHRPPPIVKPRKSPNPSLREPHHVHTEEKIDTLMYFNIQYFLAVTFQGKLGFRAARILDSRCATLTASLRAVRGHCLELCVPLCESCIQS